MSVARREPTMAMCALRLRSYLGQFDQKKLCKNAKLTGENPTTGAPTRASAGCPEK